eukprot:g18663.t1
MRSALKRLNGKKGVLAARSEAVVKPQPKHAELEKLKTGISSDLRSAAGTVQRGVFRGSTGTAYAPASPILTQVLSPAPTPEVVVPVSKASTKPTKPVPSQTSHSLQELRHKSVTDLREMLASRGVSEGSARDKADLAEWVWQHQDLPVLSSWRQKRGPKGPRRYGYGIGGEGRTADEAESEPEAPKLEANDAKQIDGDDVKLLEGTSQAAAPGAQVSLWRLAQSCGLAARCKSGFETRTLFPGTVHSCSKLLAWLEEGGAQGLSDVELIESEVFGRGLVACRDFSQHEIVVSIPTSLCLAGADELGPEEKAAAALLKEKHLGQKSRFQAYIASLTPLSMRMHPATWPKHLKWKRLFASSPGALRRIRRARTEEARWALAIVRSRAFPDRSGQLMLCPLLDLLNHCTRSAGGPTCGFVRLDGRVAMVAERKIEVNEELCHLYALSPSAELFANYGFVPEGGAGGFEEALIEVPIAATFAHRAALKRRGLDQGLSQILLRLFGNIASSWILPVARLMTLPASEVEQLEGRVLDQWQELPDPKMEMQAVALAKSWLEAQEGRGCEALRCLEDLDQIQKAAADLIRAESDLIASSIDWLRAREHRLGQLGLKKVNDYDKLVAYLDKQKSKVRKLRPEEVRFIEASIAYYRGKPVMSDEEYKGLRSKVSRSGRRKDMTALLLTERSKQFLNDEEMTKFQEAFKNAREYDFSKLESYAVGDLEELYIDALWCFHREKRALLSDDEFDELKKVLYKKLGESCACGWHELVKASLEQSQEDFQQLKTEITASGRRKDVTAFLLYERGEQFLNAEQYAAMKEEYDLLGISAVNLEECTLAQMEEMYVDELAWQGSGFPALQRKEVEFVKATLAYHRDEPLYSDEQWDELKAAVESDGMRADVAAFLLYSKGQEILDADSYSRMQKELAKIGVSVKKAGSNALQQTINITSGKLENDVLQVFFMVSALASIPTILATALVWAVGLFLDFEFVPEAAWGSILSAEFVPLFVIGIGIGLVLSNWMLGNALFLGGVILHDGKL